VSALIAALGRADPAALARLQRIVRGRRARIRLDDEAVEIRFIRDTLVVEPATGLSPVDGTGTTDRATVFDLMDGHLEVSDAISTGRLDVVAGVDAVAVMFAAIEILIDASSRSPDLQALAREFRERSGEPPMRAVRPHSVAVRPAEGVAAHENALLARLDLLPDGGDARPLSEPSLTNRAGRWEDRPSRLEGEPP
jgi:hypothetical protein